MNRKGQALVEFVLILPVFILLLLVIYDFGMIFNKKNELISKTSDIVSLYKDGLDVTEIKDMYDDIGISITSEEEYDKIIISSKIKLVTPGLNRIFGNPYLIKIERYVPNEN